MFGTSKLSKDAKSAPTGDVVAEAYDPNPAVYERLGVEPPKAPEHKLPEKRALLEKTMIAAKDRGMQVYCMYADGGGGPGGDGHHLHDERTLASRLARMVDTLEHFPMADGAVMDGPEWGYEMAPHHMNHRSYFFNDLPDSVAPMAKDLGYDYQAMVGARDRLLDLFHNLDPVRIRAHARGGLVGAHRMLGADPDLMAWLSFRVDSLTRYFRRIREGLAAELDRPIRLGCGPRSAAFAPLCGYDFVELAQFMDFLLPKHYFFHRGFDGFVGTVYRYSQTLIEWNPGLTVADTLFSEHGYAGTRLEDIAAVVPCSMSAIYDRFSSKEQLLLYMHRQGTEEAIAMIDQIQPVAAPDSDLREALPGALQVGLEMIRQFRGRRRAVLERMHADPVLLELELELREALVESGRRFLLAYRHQIKHPDPELAAAQAMRLMILLTEERQAPISAPKELQLDDGIFVQEACRMVLGYLRIPPID